MMEAIILCGGWSKRMKPEETTPKPFVKVRGNNILLEVQIEWLLGNGFDKIVLAMDDISYKYMLHKHSYILSEESVTISLEKDKLGTGGAVRKAAQLCSGDYIYIFNVDDIVDYEPKDLFDMASLKGGAILVKQPKLPYGKIYFNASGDAIKFEEKPLGDFWVSTGHYVLRRSLINKHFPMEGDLELDTWQKLANEGKLKVFPLTGRWVTINSYKELEEARKNFGK